MKLHQTILKVASMALLGSVISIQAADEKSGVPATYPLKKCVISGETLGEMGAPVKVSHDGTDVYLCCKMCISDFDKEPAKFSKLVKEAATAKSK